MTTRPVIERTRHNGSLQPSAFDDPHAEAGALGCVLLPEGGASLLMQLRRRDFFDDCNGEIYNALVELHKAGESIDELRLARKLTTQNRIERAGGLEQVSRLMESATSASNFPFWLESLREKSARRELRQQGEYAVKVAEDPRVDPSAALADFYSVSSGLFDNDCSLPPILDASEFLQNPISIPTDLVQGLLHRGSKMVLGGGSKTFKTWTLLDMAVSVGAGEQWLSFKVSPGRVLFVNFEIQPAFFQRRLQAVADAKGVQLGTRQVDVWNLRGCSANYLTLLPKIEQRIKDADYSLIILDPIYKLYGDTDENAAGSVARLLNAIEALAVTTGAAVAFGAHYSKGNQAGKDAIDRISGSGVFARDPDTILNFTRHEQEDAFTVEATLRNLKPIPPFVVEWLYPLMRRAENLDPARLKKPAGRRPEHDSNELLASLPAAGLRTKEWEAAAKDQCGIYGSTFHRLRRELKKSQKLLRCNRSQLWKPIKP